MILYPGNKASDIYIVCEFFSESTLRGSYKHHRTPFYCEIFRTWQDAHEDLRDRVLKYNDTDVRTDQDGKAVIYDPNILPPSVDEIHTEGDAIANMMEKQVRILTAEQLITDNTITLEPPDTNKKKLGAGLGHVYDELESLDAIRIEREDDIYSL